MSNPLQRAKVARVIMHRLAPIPRAIDEAWGHRSALNVVAEVTVVDNRPAAWRLAFAPPRTPPHQLKEL